jgi:hypothetical protein
MRSDCIHHAGHITAGDQGQREAMAGYAPAHPQVQMIKPGSAHSKTNFIGRWLWHITVNDLQDIGRSVLCNPDGFHGSSLKS